MYVTIENFITSTARHRILLAHTLTDWRSDVNNKYISAFRTIFSVFVLLFKNKKKIISLIHRCETHMHTHSCIRYSLIRYETRRNITHNFYRERNIFKTKSFSSWPSQTKNIESQILFTFQMKFYSILLTFLSKHIYILTYIRTYMHSYK